MCGRDDNEVNVSKYKWLLITRCYGDIAAMRVDDN